MPDEQQGHPLYQQSGEHHPLTDRPPEQKKPKGVAIPIPQNTEIPVLTYALLFINVGIFLLRYIMPELSNTILVNGYSSTEAIINGGEYYRIFTSMFLHFNEAHILFNGIALYYLGTNLERLFGSLRFGIIYLLGGLAGSMLPLFVSAGGLGASGAVFALWGAEVIFLHQNRHIFGKAGQARLQQSLIYMALNFFIGFSANALADVANSGIRISNAAHFGGLIGGVILTWFIGPRFLVQRKQTVEEGEIPVEIIQGNPLRDNLSILLYFIVALLGLLLLASLFRT